MWIFEISKDKKIMYKQEKPSISNKCDDDDEKICHNHDKYEYKSYYTTTTKTNFLSYNLHTYVRVCECLNISPLFWIWFFCILD